MHGAQVAGFRGGVLMLKRLAQLSVAATLGLALVPTIGAAYHESAPVRLSEDARVARMYDWHIAGEPYHLTPRDFRYYRKAGFMPSDIYMAANIANMTMMDIGRVLELNRNGVRFSDMAAQYGLAWEDVSSVVPAWETAEWQDMGRHGWSASVAGAPRVAPAPTVLAAEIKCPNCGMMMGREPKPGMDRAVKIGDTTYYCCAGCGMKA
jgi:hypothetical protein